MGLRDRRARDRRGTADGVRGGPAAWGHAEQASILGLRAAAGGVTDGSEQRSDTTRSAFLKHPPVCFRGW